MAFDASAGDPSAQTPSLKARWKVLAGNAGDIEMKEDAFSTFERQGWEKLAQAYHSYYATLTNQSIDALLVALSLQPGDRLLDVAAGPGYLAASAAARGANAFHYTQVGVSGL
ncbi:class I SAM-dependent methyltransferase [Burkholderia ubonensis]|uniref:class I SAM-dependent methyltransferase n=1 Tax=Burkholderia ubonensis TaxID=101571 RepID=UPI0018E012DF|nr:class I SAM-dependent methyltransferase [Burkholderia ubonensis]